MGVMNKMRNNMQVILIFVIFAFVLTIIFSWGMGGFKGKQSGNNIGKIDGFEITTTQYFNALNEQKKRYREQKGEDLSLQEIEQIKTRVWESIVSEVLWQQEIENQGLMANSDEIYFYLENNPPEFLREHETFQTDGTFDMAKYLNALQNPQGDEWIPVENYARSTIPYIKLNNYISTTIAVSGKDALEEYSHKNTKYNISYLLIKNDFFRDDSIEISDNKISKYYKNNKDDKYLVPAKRVIQYKVWNVVPSKDDSTLLTRDIEDVKLRFKEGEKFTDLARMFSQGPSANQGGDLGYIEKGMMVPAFEKVAFSAPLNKIIGPVKTRFGQHLILVTDKKVEDGKTKIKTAHILFKLTAGPSTIDNLISKANIFSGDAIDFGFEKALLEHKFSADTTKNGFTEESFFFREIGYFPYLSRWAFKSPVGEISKPIQLEDKIVVAQILEDLPESYKPIEKVKKSIIKELKKEAEYELSKKFANEIYNDITSNENDLKLFSATNDKVEWYENTSFSLDNPPMQYLNNEIFANVIPVINDGTITPPIKVYNGYCIIKKISSNINTTEFDIIKTEKMVQLLRIKQNEEAETWRKYLKEEAEIKDYRSDYF